VIFFIYVYLKGNYLKLNVLWPIKLVHAFITCFDDLNCGSSESQIARLQLVQNARFLSHESGHMTPILSALSNLELILKFYFCVYKSLKNQAHTIAGGHPYIQPETSFSPFFYRDQRSAFKKIHVFSLAF